MPQIVCPGCARKLNLQDSLAGKKVRCPGCAAVVPVPLPAQPVVAGSDGAATVPPVQGAATADRSSALHPSSTQTVRPDPYATVPHSAGTLVSPSGDDRAPPGYEMLGVLGRGGMGIVYKARQRALNRPCALKMILSGDHAGADERVRFLAEAEAIAKVKHPGIVQVYDFGTHRDLPYFSLELCEGGSLAGKLRDGTLPPREASGLLEEIARAVHAAQKAGIVHRDPKPGNVLLTEDGSPRVTDFGLAKRIEGGGTRRRARC